MGKRIRAIAMLTATVMTVLLFSACSPEAVRPGSDVGNDIEIGRDNDDSSVSGGHDTQGGDETQDGDGGDGGEDTTTPETDTDETGGEETPDEGKNPDDPETPDDSDAQETGGSSSWLPKDRLLYEDIYDMYIFGEPPDAIDFGKYIYQDEYEEYTWSAYVGLLGEENGEKWAFKSWGGLMGNQSFSIIKILDSSIPMDKRLFNDGKYGDTANEYLTQRRKYVDPRDLVLVYGKMRNNPEDVLTGQKTFEITGYSPIVDPKKIVNDIDKLRFSVEGSPVPPVKNDDIFAGFAAAINYNGEVYLVINNYIYYIYVVENYLPDEIINNAYPISGGISSYSSKAIVEEINIPLSSCFLIYYTYEYDISGNEKTYPDSDENGYLKINLITYSRLTGGDEPDLDMQWPEK